MPVNVGRGRWLEHGDLLPERKDFQGRVAATAEEDARCRQQREQEIEHGSTLIQTMWPGTTRAAQTVTC